MPKSELPLHMRQDKRGHTHSPNGAREKREHAKSTMKDHFVAMVGEFVGTFMFLWFAFAGHLMAVNQHGDVALSNQSNSSTTVIYISMAYGFSLLVVVWGFYRISGGLFNPAVTMTLAITGNLPIIRTLLLLPAQIIAGIVAAGLVKCMFPGDIRQVNTTLAPGVSIAQGVFIEMFLTSLLCHTVLMLAAEKSKTTFLAPVGIGLSLFVAEIAGVYYTGASLNPARSFGPAVAGPSFPGYHWIYWVGPYLGALLAAAYYWFNKWAKYEEANAGQDSSDGSFAED